MEWGVKLEERAAVPAERPAAPEPVVCQWWLVDTQGWGRQLWWTGHGEQFYLGVQDELQGEATVDRYAWSPALCLSNAEFASERGLGALRKWGI